MKRSLSQLLVLVLTLTALVGNGFASDAVVCDMSADDMTMMMSHDMQGHEMMDHDMPEHDISEHGMSEQLMAMTTDTMADCCDTECKCQHGVCSTLVYIPQTSVTATDINTNQAVVAEQQVLPNVIPPSLFRPPIV